MSFLSIVPAALNMRRTPGWIRPTKPTDDYSQFMKETNAATTRMMSAMQITRSGDVDRDFAALMIPHQQCAIDMARAVLHYGYNEEIRHIAQDIIIEQDIIVEQQEEGDMGFRHIVPTALIMMLTAGAIGASEPADDYSQFMKENDAAMTRMMEAMSIKPTGDIDRDFAAMMIPHHQGAIDMARTMLRYGHNEQLRRIAQEIIVEQQQEIDAMRLAIGLPPAEPAPAPTQSPRAVSTTGSGGGYHNGHMQKEH